MEGKDLGFTDKDNNKYTWAIPKKDMNKRTGQTTRRIDRGIQNFFIKGYCFLYQSRKATQEENRELLDKWIARITLEHPHTKYVYTYIEDSGIWCYKVVMNKF